MPTAAASAEAASVQLVSGEFFGVLRLHAAARTLAVARRQPHHRRPSRGGDQRRLLAPALQRRRRRARPRDDAQRRALHDRRRRAAGFTGVWLESPVDVWVPVMMQADVRYTQNFSAENADFLKPWMPQDGLRWLEVLIVRADRDRRPGGRGAERGVPAGAAAARSIAITDPERARADARSPPGARAVRAAAPRRCAIGSARRCSR